MYSTFSESTLSQPKNRSSFSRPLQGVFHVFHHTEVIHVFADNLEVCNSRAITSDQTPEQKVLLRHNGVNLGEIEMRNDSKIHYREIRFNMIKPKVMELLFAKIPQTDKYNNLVLLYGRASKTFGHWNK